MEFLISQFPEIIKLGGWGALIVLMIGRIVITKKEKDDADKVTAERIADKDKQIALLNQTIRGDDEMIKQLADSFDKAIDVITRQREENGK